VLPIVDLAPGAEDNSLAVYFAERVRRAVNADARCAKLFSALRANIRAVDFDEGRATSLRFDHGRLTVHDGAIGIPSVTFGGPRRALESLHRLRLSDLPFAFADLLTGRVQPKGPPPESSPYTPAPGAVRAADDAPPSSRISFPPPPPAPPLEPGDLLAMLARGELRIYGLLAHPRAIARFLRLLAGGD
jgi:hypothetical protein